MKIKLDPISIFVISIVVGLFSTYYFNEFLTKVVGIEPKKSKYTLMEEEKIKYLQNLGINPYNQYGTTYRIGNFGGVPVMLDEKFDRELYDDEVIDKNGNLVKMRDLPETFDKPLREIAFHFRYTDNQIFVRYKTAPRDIIHQYDRESNYEPNHAWVLALFSNMYKNKPKNIYHNEWAYEFLDIERKYPDRKGYIYHSKEYGLEKYILNERSKKYYAQLSRDIYPTEDLFFLRDSKGNYIDIIRCSNHHRPMARRCELFFHHQMNDIIGARIVFQRVHLKDWQKIKQQSIDLLMDVVVKD